MDKNINYKKASWVIIKNKNNEYLLFNKKKSGLWTFVGWKADDWEDYYDCAIRELEEEAWISWVVLELFTCTKSFHSNKHWIEKTFIWTVENDIQILNRETHVFNTYCFKKIEDFPPLHKFESYDHPIVWQLKWEEPRKLTHD